MSKIFYNIKDSDGRVLGTFEELKQNYQIKQWLDRCGLTMYQLMHHPYLEDINFLLDIRREFQQEIESNAKYRGLWSAYWDVVVNRKLPLKPKAFTKFEQLVQGCILLREQHIEKLSKIHSLRQQLQGN